MSLLWGKSRLTKGLCLKSSDTLWNDYFRIRRRSIVMDNGNDWSRQTQTSCYSSLASSLCNVNVQTTIGRLETSPLNSFVNNLSSLFEVVDRLSDFKMINNKSFWLIYFDKRNRLRDFLSHYIYKESITDTVQAWYSHQNVCNLL